MNVFMIWGAMNKNGPQRLTDLNVWSLGNAST